MSRIREGWTKAQEVRKRWDTQPRWKRRVLFWGSCLFLAWLTAGCMATGTKIDQERLGEIAKGRTTYQEVVALYGKPNQVLIRDDGTRQASFSYVQSQVNPLSFIPVAGAFVRSGSTEQTSTVFEFDAQGILQGFSSTQGEVVTGTGILSGARQ